MNKERIEQIRERLERNDRVVYQFDRWEPDFEDAEDDMRFLLDALTESEARVGRLEGTLEQLRDIFDYSVMSDTDDRLGFWWDHPVSREQDFVFVKIDSPVAAWLQDSTVKRREGKKNDDIEEKAEHTARKIARRARITDLDEVIEIIKTITKALEGVRTEAELNGYRRAVQDAAKVCSESRYFASDDKAGVLVRASRAIRALTPETILSGPSDSSLTAEVSKNE